MDWVLAVLFGLVGGLVVGWFAGYKEQIKELWSSIKLKLGLEKEVENGFYKTGQIKEPIAKTLADGMDEVKEKEDKTPWKDFK